MAWPEMKSLSPLVVNSEQTLRDVLTSAKTNSVDPKTPLVFFNVRDSQGNSADKRTSKAPSEIGNSTKKFLFDCFWIRPFATLPLLKGHILQPGTVKGF